ncbi:MAG: histidine phosphatase family protein [Patescibacteria group bacterium]|nr:histidine phosphatase family protein [Patescibacteria group bacterium]
MTLKKVVVIRHAQSQEDINPNLSGELEDYQISITEEGENQANDIIGNLQTILYPFPSVKIYSSPSNRAIQTASIVGSLLGLKDLDVIIEHRIRNLNWGNTTPMNIKIIEKERYKVGVLYYKFPGGDDSSIFVRSIGEFVDELKINGSQRNFPENVIVVTHGFALRVIAKFLLNMSEDDFRWIRNPINCYIASFKINDFGGAIIDKPLSCRRPF